MDDDLFKELRRAGEVESHGEFTVDPSALREKMRQYQLAKPLEYGLWLVQAAVLLHASAVRVENKPSITRFELHDVHLPEAWLEHPLGGLMVAPDTPAKEAWRDFSVALNTALGETVGASAIDVICGASRTVVTRGHEKIVSRGAAEGPVRIVVHRISWRRLQMLGFGTVYLGGLLTLTIPSEMQVILGLGMATGVGLQWLSQSPEPGLPQHRIDPEAIKIHAVGEAPARFVWRARFGSLQLGIREPGQRGGVWIVRNGVLHAVDLKTAAPWPEIWIDGQALPTDLCGQFALGDRQPELQQAIDEACQKLPARLADDFKRAPGVELARLIVGLLVQRDNPATAPLLSLQDELAAYRHDSLVRPLWNRLPRKRA